MTDPQQDGQAAQLTPAARALVALWGYDLHDQDADFARRFRFLTTMVAVRAGALREIGRVVREGSPVVILETADSSVVSFIEDPQLGPVEVELLDVIVQVFGAE